MGNPWKKFKRAVSRAEDNVKNVGSAINDAATPENLAAYFVSPLIAQDVAGAKAMSGADARTALAAPGQAAADPYGYTQDNWQNLAAFNAALLAGAAGGAIGGAAQLGLAGGATGGASFGLGATGALIGAGLAGTAAYAGLSDFAHKSGTNGQPQGAETPPDIASMYANDPNGGDLSAQFQRMRKSARMLGRAGTIKYKGSGTSLGLGEQMLGDQMSLIGA